MISAFLADRLFGAIPVFIPTIFAASLCLYLWSQVSSLTGMFIWVSIFGYFGAAIQSLFPSCCASLTPDLSKAGTRPRTVLLTNMFVATIASMWISNVAAPVLCFSLIQV